MRFSLLVLSLIAVFAPLHVHGKSSDESSSDADVIDKCYADLKTKNPCPNNPKARRMHFFNQTSCQCDVSEVCLKGTNSFKDELKCDSVCGELVGNGIPGNWSTWSPCSDSCGECTQTRERSCTKDNPDNACSCKGIVVLETRSVPQDPCETVLYRLNAGSGNDIANEWSSGAVTTSDPDCIDTACALNYRNPVVDNWPALDATHIVMRVLKNDAMEHFIKFNSTGSNKKSWFDGDRVVASSWPSLVGNSAPTYVIDPLYVRLCGILLLYSTYAKTDY